MTVEEVCMYETPPHPILETGIHIVCRGKHGRYIKGDFYNFEKVGDYFVVMKQGTSERNRALPGTPLHVALDQGEARFYRREKAEERAKELAKEHGLSREGQKYKSRCKFKVLLSYVR